MIFCLTVTFLKVSLSLNYRGCTFNYGPGKQYPQGVGRGQDLQFIPVYDFIFMLAK